MSEFKTQLVTRLLDHRNGGIWTLEVPLVYKSDLLGLIVVPPRFYTDFSSVPRVIFAYLWVGNTAHASSVVHDYLYRKDSNPLVTRKQADDVMYEAMALTEIPDWRLLLIYSGIRMGGEGAFHKRSVKDILSYNGDK